MKSSEKIFLIMYAFFHDTCDLDISPFQQTFMINFITCGRFGETIIFAFPLLQRRADLILLPLKLLLDYNLKSVVSSSPLDLGLDNFPSHVTPKSVITNLEQQKSVSHILQNMWYKT